MANIKKYILHIIIISCLWGAVVWGVFEYLDDYSMHDNTITVPDLRGFTLSEVDTIIESKGLRYKVIDSVYSADKKITRGVVVKQDPKQLGQVKLNRNIYVTINSVQPQRIKFPNLIDLSRRQAESDAESFGLIVDSVFVIPNECIGCVLAQRFKGKNIKTGALIEKGEHINIVVGGGISKDQVAVPDLMDKHVEQARRVLNRLQLSLIAVYDKTVENRMDSLRAVIYKQDPAPEDEATISRGSSINLYLKVN
ncbi:MAG: PASTA domain-containing protein [Flavobacteriales bacterium]|nr:PASTA domain-containing protein [Flavobacteriales bacterium]